MERLSKEQARRIAVCAQLLDEWRPPGVVDMVEHLNLVQIDPVAAIAPSHELLAWSRLGEEFSPADYSHALESERTLVDFNSGIRPMSDIGNLLAEVQAWSWLTRSRAWLAANPIFRDTVVGRITDEGPLTVPDLPDTAEVAWKSEPGWGGTGTGAMLELLTLEGVLAVSHRVGRHRAWDLASRVYPADLVVPPVAEGVEAHARRRLTALGICRAKPVRSPNESMPIGSLGETVTVEGVKGTWQVDPDALAAVEQPFAPRLALLSPMDRLVYDKRRLADLFCFEYALEMYVPAAKRRWGYYALPILYGDRLVGKLDAKADRKAGELVVNAIHEDDGFTPDAADALDEELDSLARWLGLTLRR